MHGLREGKSPSLCFAVFYRIAVFRVTAVFSSVFAVFCCIPLSSLSAQASYLHGANSRHETVLLLLFTP